MKMTALQGTLKGMTPRPLLDSWGRLKASPIGYRLVRGTLWSLAGTLLSRALGMVSTIAIARILGRDTYGELGMIQSTVGMFGTLAGLGMGISATKYVAEYRLNDPAKSGRVIGLTSLVAWISGLLMAGALVITAPALARQTLAVSELAPLLQISAVLLLFSAVNGAQIGALSGFEAFQKIACVNLLGGLASFPLTLGGACFGGLRGAVLGMCLSQVLTTLLTHLALRGEARRLRIPLGYAGCSLETSILWRFAIPAVLSGVVMAPAMWGANVLLVHQSSGYAQLGLFNAANQWRTLALFLPGVLMQAILPIFSSLIADKQGNRDFQKTLNLAQSVMVSVAFPMCTLLMCYADWLMDLYGKSFAHGSPALIGCVFAALIQCIGAATGPAIQAKGKMWLGFAFNLSWGCIYVLLVALSAAQFGASALAFSSAIAYLVLTVWGFLYMEPNLPPGMLRRVYWALVLSGTLAGGCLLAPRPARLVLGLPVGLLVFFAVVQFLTDQEFKTTVFRLFYRRQQREIA